MRAWFHLSCLRHETSLSAGNLSSLSYANISKREWSGYTGQNVEKLDPGPAIRDKDDV